MVKEGCLERKHPNLFKRPILIVCPAQHHLIASQLTFTRTKVMLEVVIEGWRESQLRSFIIPTLATLGLFFFCLMRVKCNQLESLVFAVLHTVIKKKTIMETYLMY